MTKITKAGGADERRGALQSSRVITFVVVFWGEKFRRLFVDYCVASLLAPENLPFVSTESAHGIKAKFIICSTERDYAALIEEPLFAQLRRYAQVSLIDIGEPETSIMLHMSKGHKAALKQCIAEKTYCSVLPPDSLLANGSVRKLVQIVDSGVRVALFPGFRFDFDKVRARLVAGRYIVPDEPLAIEPRQLAAIAADSLHSELQQFEFDLSCFSFNPHSIIFRLSSSNGWLFHTVSWGIACADFSYLESMGDELLDVETIDAHFINDEIFRRPQFGEPVALADSDEFLMIPVTAEQDMPGTLLLRANPLYADRPLAQVEEIKIGFIRSLLFSPACDDFKRWAYRIPVNLHSEALLAEGDPVGSRAAAIVARALEIHHLPAPLYLVVAVCNADQLDQLFTVLLPSVLAPNNVPVLAGMPACRLLIATTGVLGAEISRHRLFERVSSLIVVEFIEIAPANLADPPPAVERALERGAARCVVDRAFGCFLGPDLLLADGTIRRIIEIINEGYEAAVVPVPSFNFQRRKRKDTKLGGSDEIVHSGRQPIVLSGRQLAASILDCVDVDEPLDSGDAPALPQSLSIKAASGFVFYGTDWGVLFYDFRREPEAESPAASRGQMEELPHQLQRMHERGKLYVVTDSDDLAMLSVTGAMAGGIALCDIARSGKLDSLSRALYLQPVWFHGADLPPDHAAVSAEAIGAATRVWATALAPDANRVPAARRFGREKPRYFYEWRIPWARRAKPDLVRTLKDTTPALRWLVLLSAGAWHYRAPIWRRVSAVLRGDRESIRWLLAHLQRAGTMMRAVDQSARAAAAQKKATRKS